MGLRGSSGGSSGGSNKWGPYFSNVLDNVSLTNIEEASFASRFNLALFPSVGVRIAVQGTGGPKTLKLLVYCRTNSSTGTPGIVGLLINGVLSALVVTVPLGAGTATHTTTASITIADDDLISIQANFTSIGGAANVSGVTLVEA